MGGLQLNLLGPFRLLCDGRPVAGFEQARLQHLLAYLVLHRAAPVSRQQLAFAFWPDTTDPQALKNLRTLLTRLRSALSGALQETLPGADRLIDVSPHTLQWVQDESLAVDVVEFERCTAQAGREPDSPASSLSSAVALYSGDLLPDCYDDWVLPFRDELRKAYGESLERLALLLEERREYGSALQAARRLLQHDPLHEEAYHHLMRLHLALGDRTEALRAYRACEVMLEQEFGARPGRPMQELYGRLHTGPETPGAGETPGLASSAPGLQAPFERMSALPLIGRRAEWARLLAAWREAAGGRPHMVLVTGEAGIGKTRLAEELCGWAGRQGATVAIAECYPEGAGTVAAYAPVAEWLRSEAMGPRLRSLSDVWLLEVAAIAPGLVIERSSVAGPAAAARRGVGLWPRAEAGPWQRTRLFEALARAVLGANADRGRGPLLLFLDDLQWCDQETLDWLGYLLRYAPDAPLLLVATVRRDEIDTRHPLMAFWLTLTRAGLLDEITLAPLDATETAALAAQVAGKTLDTSAASRIYHDTEGNPLFVVETVRGGLAEDEAGSPAEGAPASAVLPMKVRAVIRWRLAQLSPPAQALAQVAAAVGRRFSFEVLARGSGRDEGLVLDGLDELWRRDLIRTAGGSAAAGAAATAGGAYDFSHDGIRAVAYDELGPIRRRAVHQRIARVLEELGGDSSQLAYHYEQAGQVHLAIEHYRRAAAASRRIGADAAAAASYRRLLEGEVSTALSPAERCGLMLELAEEWRAIGEWARMESLCREALALAETLGEPQAVARGQAALADALTVARLLRTGPRMAREGRAGL